MKEAEALNAEDPVHDDSDADLAVADLAVSVLRGTFTMLEIWCGSTTSGWSAASAGRRLRRRRRPIVRRLGLGIPRIR
jgi:hypothetical protein